MSETPQQRVAAAIERVPYARFLGIRAELKGDELTLVMPFSQHLVGNPLLPALHGGVVGALLEVTALTQLAIASKSERFPKTVDIGIDYLRSGKPVDTFARAKVVGTQGWDGGLRRCRPPKLMPEGASGRSRPRNPHACTGIVTPATRSATGLRSFTTPTRS
ncbi:MAG: PaaI family thioesterase [Caulobacteraceae bacterium]|nr:PaaI family thioesterase [Caulobacteraceae bacterium]